MMEMNVGQMLECVTSYFQFAITYSGMNNELLFPYTNYEGALLPDRFAAQPPMGGLCLMGLVERG